MKRGYVNLWRKIWDNWLWSDPDTRKLKWWLDILMLANHSASEVRVKGETYQCAAGQCIMSLNSWAARWGTSKATVDRFLRKLEAKRQVIRTPLRNATLLTVCNYEIYQPNGDAGRNARRNARRTQTINNKHYNKENCIKEKDTDTSIETRKDGFVKDMEQFREKYDAETLNGFYRYWTEEDKDGRMRFEQEKFWNTASRLRRWNDKPLR